MFRLNSHGLGLSLLPSSCRSSTEINGLLRLSTVPKTYEAAKDLPWPLAQPGDIIKRDILEEFSMSQQALADRLKVSRKTVNELVVGKRGITADMALRLSLLTGQSPEYWMKLQMQFDLSRAIDDFKDHELTAL